MATATLNGTGFTRLPQRTIALGERSGVEFHSSVVVRTHLEWRKLLERSSSNSGLYESRLDFRKHMVMAVFAGRRGQLGHSVRIQKVEDYGDHIVVRYTITPPPAGFVRGHAVVTPFHAVKVRRSEQNVVFYCVN